MESLHSCGCRTVVFGEICSFTESKDQLQNTAHMKYILVHFLTAVFWAALGMEEVNEWNAWQRELCNCDKGV